MAIYEALYFTLATLNETVSGDNVVHTRHEISKFNNVVRIMSVLLSCFRFIFDKERELRSVVDATDHLVRLVLDRAVCN